MFSVALQATVTGVGAAAPYLHGKPTSRQATDATTTFVTNANGTMSTHFRGPEPASAKKIRFTGSVFTSLFTESRRATSIVVGPPDRLVGRVVAAGSPVAPDKGHLRGAILSSATPKLNDYVKSSRSKSRRARVHPHAFSRVPCRSSSETEAQESIDERQSVVIRPHRWAEIAHWHSFVL
jgi:hypothetical protein